MFHLNSLYWCVLVPQTLSKIKLCALVDTTRCILENIFLCELTLSLWINLEDLL